ncbi:MAG: glycerol-3-phosphate dehydrogenase/oxidase [Candidatus Eisenbacteria bacterium]|uniref:Glycerol-3-phosphate dehydrogenase/oxidase n=1 Tax=Eiseniibacteriota bacterium TaxID=2212470 RepID=A0A538U538_UNCEI|nr:MAG: glycerol-3-phosphate dehydrogenase/oxidase [Candidatus Eisenbacteria bacterium]
MSETPLDLVIVGGGITGLGVARLAARNGLTVALLERADLAAGASSASSHMLHGGLRYLEHGHYRLVREALHERTAVSRLAPGLTRPTRFVLPSYRGDRLPRWMVRAGLTMYDLLAGRANLAPHASVRAAEARALEPDLAGDGLLGAGLYTDVVMDDARLAIAVARDAAAHGALIHTRTEALAARPGPVGGIEVVARDHHAGRELHLEARAVVNATGAWGDEVRRRLVCSLTPGAPDPAPLMRPSRGVHLVFPALTRGHGLLLTARADDRVIFVIPFAGVSLVGTTEVEVASPPPACGGAATIEEIRYLRAELARALPRPSRAPVLAVTSGIRPLLAAGGAVGEAPREHRVVEDGPILTIAGGKYTSFRLMARDTLAVLATRLGRAGRPFHDPIEPLPTPLGDDQPAERLAEFAADAEFARSVEDVVRRRTRLWLTPDRGRVAAGPVSVALAARLGWDETRRRDELQRFHDALADEDRLLRRAAEEP